MFRRGGAGESAAAAAKVRRGAGARHTPSVGPVASGGSRNLRYTCHASPSTSVADAAPKPAPRRAARHAVVIVGDEFTGTTKTVRGISSREIARLSTLRPISRMPTTAAYLGTTSLARLLIPQQAENTIDLEPSPRKNSQHTARAGRRRPLSAFRHVAEQITCGSDPSRRPRPLRASHDHLVGSLSLWTKLRAHSGCVNTISWCADDLSLLASGSDDTRVLVWRVPRGSRRTSRCGRRARSTPGTRTTSSASSSCRARRARW